MVEDRGLALGIGNRGEIEISGQSIHHDASRIGTEAVDVGDWQTGGLLHAVDIRLVVEDGLHTFAFGVAPITSEVELESLASRTLEVEEVGGAPATLSTKVGDSAAQLALDPGKGALPLWSQIFPRLELIRRLGHRASSPRRGGRAPKAKRPPIDRSRVARTREAVKRGPRGNRPREKRSAFASP